MRRWRRHVGLLQFQFLFWSRARTELAENDVKMNASPTVFLRWAQIPWNQDSLRSKKSIKWWTATSQEIAVFCVDDGNLIDVWRIDAVLCEGLVRCYNSKALVASLKLVIKRWHWMVECENRVSTWEFACTRARVHDDRAHMPESAGAFCNVNTLSRYTANVQVDDVLNVYWQRSVCVCVCARHSWCRVSPGTRTHAHTESPCASWFIVQHFLLPFWILYTLIFGVNEFLTYKVRLPNAFIFLTLLVVFRVRW